MFVRVALTETVAENEEQSEQNMFKRERGREVSNFFLLFLGRGSGRDVEIMKFRQRGSGVGLG